MTISGSWGRKENYKQSWGLPNLQQISLPQKLESNTILFLVISQQKPQAFFVPPSTFRLHSKPGPQVWKSPFTNLLYTNAQRSLWMVNAVGGAVSMATVQCILFSCKPIRSSLLSCCAWEGEGQGLVQGGGVKSSAPEAASWALWAVLWPPLVALDHLGKIHLQHTQQRTGFFNNTKNDYELTQNTSKHNRKKNEQRTWIGTVQKKKWLNLYGNVLNLIHNKENMCLREHHFSPTAQKRPEGFMRPCVQVMWGSHRLHIRSVRVNQYNHPESDLAVPFLAIHPPAALTVVRGKHCWRKWRGQIKGMIGRIVKMQRANVTVTYHWCSWGSGMEWTAFYLSLAWDRSRISYFSLS